MASGHVRVSRYNAATTAYEEIRVPISDTDYYTMSDLNMTARPDEDVPRGGCAVGDILYVNFTGTTCITRCVVVTHVTPAQVHTEGVLGAAHFYVLHEKSPFSGGFGGTRAWRMLRWIPDPSRRTSETTIFRWSPAKGAYINGGRTLVRCADVPEKNYGEYKE